MTEARAPGAPGIEPRWTSSAKDGVGTAIGPSSRVWFTLSHGILNEIYYPRIDEACTRDLGLVVTRDPDFFSEEKRDTRHETETVAPGVPAYRLTNTCSKGRYRIEKTVFTDPERDVLLQRIVFSTLGEESKGYRVHVLLAPHLGNHGYGNSGRVGEYKGVPVLPVKNKPAGLDQATAEDLVSPDALALVRFGLRRPDDERIADTVRVIDGLLRVELPSGPCFRRYNGDGYGEHDDGAPFDGTGVGRPWHLLTLERAHFELAAGRPDVARGLLETVKGFMNRGLIPEQVWDANALPALELERGRPAGSAMPLVWAHAEFVKLARSLDEGTVFDEPPPTVARYGASYEPRGVRLWRFNHKPRSIHLAFDCG